MDQVTISTYVHEDRRLVLDLPDEIPTGPVEVTIKPAAQSSTAGNAAREAVRAKLLAAGFLVTDIKAPDITLLSQEEIWELGKLPEGARSSDELIDEDRGTY
jgi:hypothetical protein